MGRISKLAVAAVMAIAIVVAGFVSAVAFAAEGQATSNPTPLAASTTGERATFKTASVVRSAWTQLAGGSRDNVKAIRQYPGSALPEGVTTQIVSAAESETPIYSWFDNGTIYYWSEDTHPYLNSDASYMFNGFTKATVIDTAPFDTSNVTDMEAMFANCSSVTELDVSGFDTTNVKCMYCMFIYCSSLTTLDLSHFNTTNTTNTSDENYGSLCGMFFGCSSLTELDLSSFDMTRSSWPYHTQNMFTGCTSLKRLTLGPKNWFNGYTVLSGSWTHESNGTTLSGSALCSQYTRANAFSLSGTWIRNMPEGHYYRTDDSLGETNLWEVHTPDDRFKGYCLNLNKFGVGEELDRILANDDSAIEELLCSEAEGSTHGSEPLGSSMREALITLIYYGWPNDAAGIQQRYGLSDQEYLDITQNAIWDFTDRYDDPSGPSHYEGNELAAYKELVSQKFRNIDGEYILFLYKSWDPSKQNLLSIMGVDDQEYGGVEVRKQSENGADNLAGAVFTVYDSKGNAVGTMTSSANGTAYICRTDHTEGLPLGTYTVRETKPPAGYELSDVVYHFEITEANEIVSIGWRYDPVAQGDIEEEMIFYDKHDDAYVGGGVGVMKQSNTGKMLVGAEFTIYDSSGTEVATLVTNNSGVASTGKQDLPLGTYTVRETKAPEGHAISGDAQTVTITQNLEFIKLTFSDNEKHGSVTLKAQKVLDAEGRQLEEGEFTFQLLDDQYREIQTATNDANGNVTFDAIDYTPDDLGYKNYHIIEVIGKDANIRYDRHQEDVTVTIYDTGGAALECTAVYDSDGAMFTNKYGAKNYDVQILKKKLYTDDVVEGAVLEVRDSSKRLIGTWTSSGEAHTLKLDPGTYVLREITAPNGYFVISDARFTVAEDGTLTCGSAYVAIDGLALTVFDKPIKSTEFGIKKVDAETGEALEGAEFVLQGTEGGYSSTVVTDDNGTVRFEGLEPGTYTLTESQPPKGYQAEEDTWKVNVEFDRAISKTANINANGVASGNYSPTSLNDTVTIAGSPDSIHVELRYQTEDDYDYLLLLDGGGNVITQDMDGNPIGDTRADYRGCLWGGMESGIINTLSFDLEGDTVTFKFVPDKNTAAYGYYAVVTSEPQISVTDSAGQVVQPEEGLFVFENKQVTTASVVLGGTKMLEGRELAEGEFTFELEGPDGEKVQTTNAADGSYVFDELTFDAAGTYTYKVREVAGNAPGVSYDPTVYDVTVTVEGDGEDGLIATASTAEGGPLAFVNAYRPDNDDTSVTVLKKWDDANDADGIRPASVTVHLIADGKDTGRSVELSVENGWKATFEGLEPKGADGAKVAYTVAEEGVADYEATIAGSAETAFVITNSHDVVEEEKHDKPNYRSNNEEELVAVTVRKVWDDDRDSDGLRPTELKVILLADGVDSGKSVTLSATNSWQATVKDLPKYADGKLVSYTWTEEMPEGYELSGESADGAVTTLTNSHKTETTEDAPDESETAEDKPTKKTTTVTTTTKKSSTPKAGDGIPVLPVTGLAVLAAVLAAWAARRSRKNE